MNELKDELTFDIKMTVKELYDSARKFKSYPKSRVLFEPSELTETYRFFAKIQKHKKLHSWNILELEVSVFVLFATTRFK